MEALEEDPLPHAEEAFVVDLFEDLLRAVLQEEILVEEEEVHQEDDLLFVEGAAHDQVHQDHLQEHVKEVILHPVLVLLVERREGVFPGLQAGVEVDHTVAEVDQGVQGVPDQNRNK